MKYFLWQIVFVVGLAAYSQTQDAKVFFSDELRSTAIKIVQGIESNLTSIQQQLDRMDKRMDLCEPCSAWKKKVASLSLRRLETGVYYYRPTTSARMNWFEASRFCEDHGLKLATISSARELAIVSEAAPVKGTFIDYWVGASDIGQEPGQFKWADGCIVDAAWWDKTSLQPDKFARGQQTCVYLPFHRASLWDYKCVEKLFFLCKADAKYSNCL